MNSEIVRALLIADVVLLMVVGAFCWLWMQRPAGPVFAAALWFGSGLLVGWLRWNDPLRAQRRRDHSTW